MGRALGRIGWTAQALVAGSAVVGLAAAPASAASVLSIGGNPAQLQVGTSYRLERNMLASGTDGIASGPSSGWASGSSAGPAYWYFYDNGRCFSDGPAGSDVEVLAATWIPTSAGVHTLQVGVGSSAPTMTVTVQPAPLGAPIQTPQPVDCGNHSSPSTGSA
ncbi:hypothetical protein GCM10027167_48520 [Nocardia heshunensis]